MEEPMTLDESRQDMRTAHAGGATGLLASALAWLIAALVAAGPTPQHAVIALFIAGCFIYPVSVLFAKAIGRTGAHRKGNPLAPLAVEGTILMMMGLPLAYVVSLHRLEFFFPAMMLIIGGRYLTFATLYGLKVYWVVGGVLAVAAYGVAALHASVQAGAFTGAAVESVFAVVVFLQMNRDDIRANRAITP